MWVDYKIVTIKNKQTNQVQKCAGWSVNNYLNKYIKIGENPNSYVKKMAIIIINIPRSPFDNSTEVFVYDILESFMEVPEGDVKRIEYSFYEIPVSHLC